MKIKHLILIITILALSCDKNDDTPEPIESNCNVPQLLVTEYERDIKNLAIRRMYQVQSPDTSIIEIPQKWMDTIAQGLAAIFNATHISERDTIFNLYCIHDNSTSLIQTYKEMIIRVDTSYAWTQAWQNLNPLTGNLYIDSIVRDYNLSITEFFNFSSGNYAIIHIDSLLNIYALIEYIEKDPGVIWGEPNEIIGSPGKITYDKIGSIKYYDFYFEFNDCTNGCDNYTKWKFKVNPDCSVEYLGYDEWGYFGVLPLPSPINCNTFN